ncbi:MAG: PKD domain-containing protein, partial [Flavobacteriales bacterium]|nr:PKD domain-containing protein [Flavobacteriales bacterium]
GNLDGQIASSQAFWVKTKHGSPNITFSEKSKVNNKGVHMKAVDLSTQTTIKIKLQGDGVWDETVIGFHDGATPKYDSHFDAYKFFSSNESLPNLATIADTAMVADAETDNMSINMWPVPEEELPVDLVVKKGEYSELTFINDMVDSYDDNICLVLEDRELGVVVPFNQGDVYSFVMGEESTEDRFSLKISAPLIHEEYAESCPEANDGSAVAFGYGPEPWNFIWADMNGNVIKEVTESSTPDTIEGLEPGVYDLTVTNGNEKCPSASNVVIINPAAEQWAEAEVMVETCSNEALGELKIKTEESYSWTVNIYDDKDQLLETMVEISGDTIIEGVPAGAFYMEMLSSCGNEVIVEDIQTTHPQSVEANFEVPTTPVDLSAGGSATFVNISENADAFVWEFNNGVVDSTNIDGQHIFTTAGMHEVTLKASNEFCADSYTKVIAVIVGNDETVDIEEDLSSLDPDKVTDINKYELDEKMAITFGQTNITIKSDVVISQEVKFQIF